MRTAEERNAETQLRAAAAARGAQVNALPNGHFQIKGVLLVNYYPFAKRRTAYIAATTRGIRDASIAQAVALAFAVPPMADAHRVERRAQQTHIEWETKAQTALSQPAKPNKTT